MKKKNTVILILLSIFFAFPQIILAETDSEKLIGLIQVWTSNAEKAPKGYLVADGRAVSRTTYKKLFDKIGTTYGAGDGSTTFNLPNLSGRTVVGVNTSDNDFSSLGKKGGEKAVALSVSQMPSHTHIQKEHNHLQNSHTHVQDQHTHTQVAHTHIQNSHTHAQNSHNHSQNQHRHDGNGWSFSLFIGTQSNEDVGTIAGSTHKMTQVAKGSGFWSNASTTAGTVATNTNTIATNNPATATNNGTTAINRNTTAINENTTAINKSTVATNQNTGGGKAHNNLQPYVVMNYIIKYE